MSSEISQEHKLQDLDCLIIGGGPAGLTAAIYLARYRRRVVVFDDQDSRAVWIPKSRNYPGFPTGISGQDLLSLLAEQASRYNIKISIARIDSLKATIDGFCATHVGGWVRARKVLLATGIVDKAPTMTDLDGAVSDGSIRYCPVCDGYEATDRRIAVLGSDSDALAKARFLRSYSKDVTLLLQSAILDAGESESLARLDIPVIQNVGGLSRFGKRIRIDIAGDQCTEFDIVYPALGCDVRSELAAALGALTTKAGTLKVDEHQQTTVSGLYASGDVVSDLHQITVATAHAAIAATHIHNSLPMTLR